MLSGNDLPGDANLDGRFDQSDILDVLQAGKYGTDQHAEWGEGDWTGDGKFDRSDIVAALQTAAYLRETPPTLNVVAEYAGIETFVDRIAEGTQWVEDGVLHLRNAQTLYFDDVTDVRLHGEAVIIANADVTLTDPPVNFYGSTWGEMRIEKDDGRWEGPWIGERTAEGHSYIWAFLDGEGAYDGLHAHATYVRETVDDAPFQIAGVILTSEEVSA
jgi:hypothetical protein